MSPKKKVLHGHKKPQPETVRFKNRKTGREMEAEVGSKSFNDLHASPDLFAVVPDKGTASEKTIKEASKASEAFEKAQAAQAEKEAQALKEAQEAAQKAQEDAASEEE